MDGFTLYGLICLLFAVGALGAAWGCVATPVSPDDPYFVERRQASEGGQ